MFPLPLKTGAYSRHLQKLRNPFFHFFRKNNKKIQKQCQPVPYTHKLTPYPQGFPQNQLMPTPPLTHTFPNPEMQKAAYS
ncbi:hypothetical protein THIOSC13_1350050 [uncultured Thiomicrorhabdus sp.]